MEAVRRRPAMYVGSTGPEGLHHLVYEVVENSIDESLAGYCRSIEVVLYPDGSCSVTDDGRGIPVDTHPTLGRPACELVLTTLHSGSKFGGGAYEVSGGLHGVGVSCVNALSSWTLLDVQRDGRSYHQEFARGKVTSDVVDKGPSDRTGTRLHFLPDDTIFSSSLSAEVLAPRLEELAFLHPGITIVLDDRKVGHRDEWQYETGIAGYALHLNRGRTVLHDEPIHFKGVQDGVEVEVALQWTTAYTEQLSGYVNSIHTPQGGSHISGLQAALTWAVNHYAEKRQLLSRDAGEDITGYDIREGLTAVLSLRMAEPEFEGQTKSTLSSRVTRQVETIAAKGLITYLDNNREIALRIVGKALEASRARLAARRASERANYRVVDPKVTEEIYTEQFGIRSANWHDSCTWLTDQTLLEAHAAMADVPEDAVLLDVCCGSGVVGNSFRAKVSKIVGLDLTPEMIKKAKTRLDEVHRGNVYEIPFDANTFDMVCTREVLHLLPKPEKPVAQIFRVLKPGGQFVVGQILPYGEADAAWMYRIFKKKQPLFFNNPLDTDFVEMLEGCGFVDIRMTEVLVWESIDLWIDTHETTSLHRHEIRQLYYNAPEEVRRIHPFEVTPSGKIRDQWRWCIFSARKPA
jgi:DNA gyrase subunit B